MIVFLLVACGVPSPKESTPVEQDAPVTDELDVSPTTLDLGTLDAPGTATLTLTNHGDGLIALQEVSASSADLSFTTSAEDLPPGGTAEITVSWSPLSPTTLSDEIEILALSSETGPHELSVPVTGQADWAVVDLQVSPDLGTVKVGCDTSADVVVANAGTTDLVVDRLALGSGVDFKLQSDGGDLPAFPWTLAPGASQTVQIVFTPLDDGGYTETVVATTNDPVTPEATAEVTANGTIEEQNSIEYTVQERQASTVYFSMNESAVSPTVGHGTRLQDALPVFFETLQSLGVTFRMGFSTQSNALNLLPVEYVDSTLDPAEAAAIVSDALPTAVTTNNDYQLMSLSNALTEHGDWLFEEGGTWDDSYLNLIGINYDNEVSPGSVTTYIEEYQSYKDDPSDVVIHAIAGPLPRGCGDAIPTEMLDAAVTATGGVFLEYCDTDWTDNMTTLAKAIVGDRTHFTLTGDPAVWSIEVSIDGVDAAEGWSYDETDHEVIFEPDAYPETGSQVRIDYVMTTTCDD